MVSLIAAISMDNVIGKDNKLPWYIPRDLKRFKKLTSGHPIIMGITTFNSIGDILPNRTSYVLTTQNTKGKSSSEENSSVKFYNNLEKTIYDSLKENNEVFIIGRASVYEQSLPYLDKIYITEIDITFEEKEGLVYFPKIDWLSWNKINESPTYSYKGIFYRFKTYVRS